MPTWTEEANNMMKKKADYLPLVSLFCHKSGRSVIMYINSVTIIETNKKTQPIPQIPLYFLYHQGLEENRSPDI